MSDQPAQAQPRLRSPSGARYAVIASRWNGEIVDILVDGACTALAAKGVEGDAVDVLRVPGAWELPMLAQRVATAGGHAVIIALGCVVRGETRHYEHVADECARGLMRVALDHRLPVANGVLAVEQHADAEARADGALGNKGEEAALAAMEMAHLLPQLGEPNA